MRSRDFSITDRASFVEQTPTSFRVHSSVYYDADVFRDEMRLIFDRSWVYVGHESQLAEAGDYITGRIGTQPTIVTRNESNDVTVLLNVCRHRANAICREDRGNSSNFRCPYHGWTYTNTGHLIGVSDRARYPQDFDSGMLDLIQAPMVGTYRGLIFASLNEEVSPLDDHLSLIRPHIDLWADRSIEGDPTVLLPHKYSYPGNWKFQAENGVDGYHPGVTHESAFSSYAAHGMGTGRPVVKHGHISRGFPGGHSTIEGGYDDARGIGTSMKDHYQHYMTELTERHGDERAEQITTNRHLFIFPNVFIMDDLIRVVQPIAPDETDVYSYPIRLGGVSDEFNARRLYETTRSLSTTGLLNPADLEMFAANQTGLSARKMEWLQLHRGLGQEEVCETGERVGVLADETAQRALFIQWAACMAGNEVKEVESTLASRSAT